MRELDELRALWLSRLMFGWMVDAKHGEQQFTETRSFEEFCEAVVNGRSVA